MNKNNLLTTTLIATAFLCFSCKNDTHEVYQDTPIVKSKNITIDEALEKANTMFAMIDTKQSKSKSRVPKKVEVLGFNNTVTRSPDNNTDSSFYIVNYQDNQGFAIINAKHKTAPVYAICDQGEFDVSDTINPGIRMTLNAMATQAQSDGWYERIPDVIDYKYPHNSHFVMSEKLIAKYGPYGAHRKWGQNEPFNKYCPTINGGVAAAGSAAVATALIMAHHKHPISIMGHKLNWKEIDKFNASAGQQQAGLEGLTRLLSSLGHHSLLNIQYGSQNSSAQSYYVPSVLAAFQYEVGGFEPYHLTQDAQEKASRQQIIDHFANNKSPVYMRAYTDMIDDDHTSNNRFYHDWVVDGLLQINAKMKMNGNGNLTYLSQYDYIYCNWGWEGKANGWYVYRNLDLMRGPIKGELGETWSTNRYNFYKNIEILRHIKRYY